MTAGILQLQARSEQDDYFIGNPEVSFFKFIYRRHTNFSMQTYELLFKSAVKWGAKMECDVLRKGDLLSKMYVQIRLPPLSNDRSNTSARWVTNIGHVLIKSIEIEIGGQRIDQHTGEFLYLCNQLTTDGNKKNGMDYMIGYEVDPFQEKVIYIPLHFWFNRNYSCALPIIALTMHEIKIRLNLRHFNEVTIGVDQEVDLIDISLIADYILLDIPERTKLQNTKQQYLIEQMQENTENRTTKIHNNIDLMFKHNVKELIWMVRRYVQGDIEETDAKDWFNFTFKNNQNPIKDVTLRINGQEKISNLPGEYFNLVQTYQHHSSIPDNPGICVYSFALNPEKMQPSGSYNFSCIDNAELQIELYHDYFFDFGVFDTLNGNREVTIQVYAISYNFFETENGKGKLLYE